MNDTENGIWRRGESGRLYAERFPHDLDARVASRAALGVIALDTDQVIERDLRALTESDGIHVYATRLPNQARISIEGLLALERHIAERAAGLLPGVRLDALGFGCTSGAVLIGEARVQTLVNAVRPGVPVTTPIGAARAALAALGVRTVGVLTPYPHLINERLCDNLESHGFTVAAIATLDEDDDLRACRITPESLLRAAVAVGRAAPVEGVFISCTSLRAAGIVPAAEAELGIPVTSSNHALAWHLLRLAGVSDLRRGRGRLFETAGHSARD